MQWSEYVMRGIVNKNIIEKHLRRPFIGAHQEIGADPARAIVSHNTLLWNSQSYSDNNWIHDFGRVALAIFVQNCIVL